jgi:head-tail adaptor
MRTVSVGEFDQYFYVDTSVEAVDSSGQLVSDWTAPSSVRRWGRFVPRSNREFVEAQQNFTRMEWLIEMHGRLAITTRDRMRTNDSAPRYLEILGVWCDEGKPTTKADFLYVACRAEPVAVADPT